MKVREWLKTATRQQMIDFCVDNDRNGCYVDDEHVREFDCVITEEDLRFIITDWTNEDPEMEMPS